MEKFAKFIVHNRYVFFGLFIAILIASCILIPMVHLNYDMTKYLSDSSEGKIALNKMIEEFGQFGSMNVMICDVTPEEAQKIADKITKVDGIASALFDANSEASYKVGEDGKGDALISVFLGIYSFSDEAITTVNNVEQIAKDSGYKYAMNGSAVDMVYYQTYVMQDMTIILIVACIVIAIILLLSSKSYFEPVIFAIVLAFAILINLGTNYFMGEISFITNAICAILQLALAMDYSIILLQRYEEEKTKTVDDRAALEKAIAASVIPVCSSALTTIAGLLALVFMQFKIGFDVGIVLAKGIVISLFTVFFFMPSLIMIFHKPIEKTQHKPIRFKYKWLQKFAEKTVIVVPVILIIAIVVAGVFNFRVSYSYVLKTATAEDAPINVDNELITSTYGDNTPLIVMIPDKADGTIDYAKQQEIIDYCTNLEVNGRKVVKSGTALCSYSDMVITKDQLKNDYNLSNIEINILWRTGGFSGDSITVGDLIKLIRAEEQKDNSAIYNAVKDSELIKLLNMMDNGSYSRIILNMDAASTDQDAFDTAKIVREYITDNYDSSYVISESAVYLDIKDTFDQDTVTISLITVIGIFLLVLLTFKSISIPVILVGIIQGAIWLNFSINAWANDPIFFVAYLVVMCIQMGATVDYGILMTSRYLEARKTQDKLESLGEALYTALPTVFTSGSILIIAPLLVGIISNVEIISNIGYLLCRGCLWSVFLIVVCLPQMLLLCDKLIQKTTWKLHLKEDIKAKAEKVKAKTEEIKNDIKDKVETKFSSKDNNDNTDEVITIDDSSVEITADDSYNPNNKPTSSNN